MGDFLLLVLILAFTIRFSTLITLEEDDLADAFVGIDLAVRVTAVGQLDGEMAPPAWLNRSHVADDSEAGVGGLANADTEYVLGHVELLLDYTECIGVGREDEAFCSSPIHKRPYVTQMSPIVCVRIHNESWNTVEDLEIIPTKG